MQHRSTNIVKRLVMALLLVSFVTQAVLPAWAEDLNSLRAPLKSNIADEDTDEIVETVKKANVLFLVESTAAMSFSPKGVMPLVAQDPRWNYGIMEAADWVKTQKQYGYGFNDIQKFMEQSTFGMGALPAAWSGASVSKQRNLYGRDIDNGNNYVKFGGSIAEDMEANKDRYYFPFADPVRAKTLKEAYSNQTTPMETHFTGAIRPYDSKDKYVADYLKANKYMGSSNTVSYNYTNLQNGTYPYALVFKDPKYWQNGWTGSGSPTADDLVPNDSRMYQAKLALWRLLEDESLFRNIRIGLSTTFLSPVNTSYGFLNMGNISDPRNSSNNRTDFNTIFRVKPFGNNIYTHRYFDTQNDYTPINAWDYNLDTPGNGMMPPKTNPGNRYQTLNFKNGILLMNITGHPSGWEAMHGQFFPMWANTQVAPDYNMDNDPYGNKHGWTDVERWLFKLENRASLHVPIADYDHLWTRIHRYTTYEITQSDKIRMWINGLADMKSAGPTLAIPYTTSSTARDFASNTDKDERNSQFHFFKDPEIGIAGTFALPNAIFPDPNPKYDLSRDKSLGLGSRSVWYSDATSNTNYLGYFRADSARIHANPKAYFTAGSGEAAGSVIDFFSPDIRYNMAKEDTILKGKVSNSKAIDLANLTDLSFPIRNACEDNWLVVIASGMEIEPIDSSAYKYNSWDAIKNLYDYTDKKNPKRGKVTMMSYKWDDKDGRKKRHYDPIDLDKPIRTLVVGIAADPDDPEIKRDPILKKQVEKMRENLNRMARAGQGLNPDDQHSDVTAYFADDVPTLLEAIREAMLFINDFPTERPGKGSIPAIPSMNGGDDSLGLFAYSYKPMRSNQWVGSLSYYEASRNSDGKLSASRGWELGNKLLAARGKRNLKYWSNASGSFVDLNAGDSNFEKLTGMSAKNMTERKMQSGTFAAYPPHDALRIWLQGYDHSYALGRDFERANMLADIGQSGITVVTDPAVVNSLPGYMAWAQNIKDKNLSRPPMLYLQTNDGILHVVDPSNGNEKLSILPPPVLMPFRLATLKTRTFENKMEWIDVTAAEGSGKLRSNPVYTLDGSLQKKYFDMSSPHDGSGWGTYLLGALGRGGSGLYMLDVSTRDKPKFLWYREKIGDGLMTLDHSASNPVFEKNDSLNEFFLPYMNLGFNSPKPGMGVTGNMKAGEELNFIAMAGGVQTNLNLDKNGLEGSVLVMLNPKDGSVIKAFDSAAVGKSAFKIGGGITGRAPYMGMMNSEPTLFRSDINPYLTGHIYAADNRGNIFKISMEEKDTNGNMTPLRVKDWKISTIATLQADTAAAQKSASSYSIPHGLLIETVKSEIWAAGGTADVPAIRGKNLTDGVISNDIQMIFGLRAEGNEAPFTRSQMKSISPDDTKSALGTTENYKGWYISLAKKNQKNFREHVSAKPMVINGTLFVATFIQNSNAGIDNANVCAFKKRISGNARLYALDITTGGANFWTGDKSGKAKYITMSGAKITGLTLAKDGKKNSLLLNFDNLTGNFDPNSLGRKNVKSVTGHDNIMEITELPSSSGGSAKVTNGNSVVIYWTLQ